MDFVLRLSALYAGLFGAIGVQLPFLPLWMAAKGLEPGTIGLVLAGAGLMRVAAAPIGTRAADRFTTLKLAIVLATTATATALTVLGTAGGALAIGMAYALAASASSIALPLTEAYALRGLAERGRAYGPVRLFGSLAFIAGALATGALAGWLAPVQLIWVLVAVAWSTAVAACLLRPVTGDAPAVARGASVKSLVRMPALVAVIVASGLTQGSHALLYGFGTLQWTAAGLGGVTIATLWSLGVVAEIVLFAFSGRLQPALGAIALLIIGAAGATVRWIAMAFSPPVELLALLQCLHALSFGATHLGAVQFVARAAPPGLAGTAQGLLAAANGCGMAAAMALSGLLQARFGLAAYAAMALIAAAGFMTALHARRVAEK